MLDVLTGLVSVRNFRHRLTVFDTRRSPSVGTCTVSVGVDEERGSGLAGTLALDLVLGRFGVVDAEDGRIYDSDSTWLGPSYLSLLLPTLPLASYSRLVVLWERKTYTTHLLGTVYGIPFPSPRRCKETAVEEKKRASNQDGFIDIPSAKMKQRIGYAASLWCWGGALAHWVLYDGRPCKTHCYSMCRIWVWRWM